MEMKKLSGGNLRAVGYDEKTQQLQVELNAGTFVFEHVSRDTWQRFVNSSSPWSFFRDNIEEEYTSRRIKTADKEDAASAFSRLFADPKQ